MNQPGWVNPDPLCEVNDERPLESLTRYSAQFVAIGAKVKIVAGNITQTAEIHCGGSYLSQNDVRVHFGLGPAKMIDSAEIRWPSGRTDTLRNIESDKFYAILEGKGIVQREEIQPSHVP